MTENYTESLLLVTTQRESRLYPFPVRLSKGLLQRRGFVSRVIVNRRGMRPRLNIRLMAAGFSATFAFEREPARCRSRPSV